MKLVLILIFSTILFNKYHENEDIIWVDNFESAELDDWHGRASDFKEIYKINNHPDSSFLSAYSKDSDNFIIKKVKIDLVEYPFLNWKWRAKSLPIEGDESEKSKCDMAASVIVVLRASKWRPQSIKYTWSSTLPQNTFTESPYAFWPARTDIIVMQSGEEHLNQWVTEKVNVLDHYKALYKKKKVKSKNIEAFVIMTDSDNTESLSEADYDNIYFSKS